MITRAQYENLLNSLDIDNKLLQASNHTMQQLTEGLRVVLEENSALKAEVESLKQQLNDIKQAQITEAQYTQSFFNSPQRK